MVNKLESFKTEKRSVFTKFLEIVYEEQGPPDGFPVILLHGFPDDVRAWDAVAVFLASAGYRVLVPYLRGFGTTRFLDEATPRVGQQAAIGQDVLDLMDSLNLSRATLAGYDWGSRAACVASILAPERIRGLISIGGYNVHDTISPPRPSPAAEEKECWYQWYFNTERGRVGLETNRRDICRMLWHDWSPSWHFDDATFERTARSFDNPDFVRIVIHEYRHSHGNASGDPRFDIIERNLAKQSPITIPAIILHGDEDKVHPLYRSASNMSLFPKGTERRIIHGAGHFVPREKPEPVAEAISQLLTVTS